MTSATSAPPQLRARQFQALSDETRLRILALLREGEHCVCELTEALELGQSLLSFHLKTLKEVGLVTDRREGRWMFYSVAEDSLHALASSLSELKPKVQTRAHRRNRCKER